MAKDKEPEIEIYNEAQRWWINIQENCETTIKQFENSIKLQKEIKNLAENKLKELATNKKV